MGEMNRVRGVRMHQKFRRARRKTAIASLAYALRLSAIVGLVQLVKSSGFGLEVYFSNT